MNNTRASFAMTKSPFQNNSLLATGGEIFPTQNFDEVMVEGKWQHSPVSLPLPIREHCMVLINSTTVMVLGGYFSEYLNSTYTLVLNGLKDHKCKIQDHFIAVVLYLKVH